MSSTSSSNGTFPNCSRIGISGSSISSTDTWRTSPIADDLFLVNPRRSFHETLSNKAPTPAFLALPHRAHDERIVGQFRESLAPAGDVSGEPIENTKILIADEAHAFPNSDFVILMSTHRTPRAARACRISSFETGATAKA